jgi:DNA helicase-2/ATP-dependent DNA helicase PcrA
MENNFYSILEGLNSAQREAVEQFEGPALIVAGAGSGKTKVLTNRIANILEHGQDPSGVLALTFTNKASGEMKERIAAIVGWKKARYIWMGTFHAVFLKFLKDDAELLGYPKNFTVFDTSASRSAVRSCIKELSLDEKMYKPADILSRISVAKNNLFTASAYAANQSFQQRDILSKKPKVADIFALYEKKCKLSGAMDFDDILLNTNIMLRDFPEVLDKLRNRFSFILVDEYQDTNYSQYLIIKKLAANHQNICVVGDDAQSIYAFRGAKIENILNFRKDYPHAKEFRLEQNYRSTQTIVNAANSLIAKNSLQIKKECFSAAEPGDKIEFAAFTIV